MSQQHYEPKFKKKLVRLHLEEGRTLQSLSVEYCVAKASITIWFRKFSNECREQALTNPIALNELEIMKENRRLRAELEEAHKENLFLESVGILCKRNQLEAYRFIDKNKDEPGVRQLLRRLDIYPNAYYNYLRHRKSSYLAKKHKTLETISEIYHKNNGVVGYRNMKVYLERKGVVLSHVTVHKYMNKELGLVSIVRRKKPTYERREAHKKFDNLINQNFAASGINQNKATDFTYLFLSGGDVRYNCTIIDLYDRSVVASVTDRHITSDLAIRTLQKALDSQKSISKDIILHSDQGSQYTSKVFTEFCEKKGITQSMSKAGYPYDNAPMEKYFNTLKNEEIYLHNYHKEQELYDAVQDFAYVKYNHVRPHAYNGYRTPFEARYAV